MIFFCGLELYFLILSNNGSRSFNIVNISSGSFVKYSFIISSSISIFFAIRYLFEVIGNLFFLCVSTCARADFSGWRCYSLQSWVDTLPFLATAYAGLSSPQSGSKKQRGLSNKRARWDSDMSISFISIRNTRARRFLSYNEFEKRPSTR